MMDGLAVSVAELLEVAIESLLIVGTLVVAPKS